MRGRFNPQNKIRKAYHKAKFLRVKSFLPVSYTKTLNNEYPINRPHSEKPRGTVFSTSLKNGTYRATRNSTNPSNVADVSNLFVKGLMLSIEIFRPLTEYM